MKYLKIIVLLTLSYGLMGATQCEQVPPHLMPPTPPNLEGSWQWSCADLGNPTVIEQKTGEVRNLLLNCAQQVPAKSPFMTYVKEYISFDTSNTVWSALFAFGSCVDAESGNYKYSFNPTTRKHELEIYDAQGVLQQTYSVEKAPDSKVKMSTASKSCLLTQATPPPVLKGSHPRPVTTIDWQIEVDGISSLSNTNAQFPFVYQTPQLQSRGRLFNTYRADYAILNIAADGSSLAHYAAYIVLYDQATNTPLKEGDVKELSSGQAFDLDYVDPANGSKITIHAVFN